MTQSQDKPQTSRATADQGVFFGALRVWWIPQIPGEPFYVHVNSTREALMVMEVLGRYDQFQLDHRIKPDYSNAGGLEVYEKDGGEGMPGWCEWYDPETGDDICDLRLGPTAAGAA
jgi:hypothetical protein